MLARSWLLTSCLTLMVPAMNGRKAESALQLQSSLICLSHHTEVFEGVWVGDLCAIEEKGRQTASRPGVQVHYLRPSTIPITSDEMGVFCQGLLLGVNSQFVK
jgi:hypothetical protein